jgi:hypothetical protein
MIEAQGIPDRTISCIPKQSDVHQLIPGFERELCAVHVAKKLTRAKKTFCKKGT